MARVAAAVATLLVVACKDEPNVDEQNASEHLASAYCEQVFDCRCIESAGFTSVEACHASVLSDLREQQSEAVAGSLVYDATCVDAAIGRIDDFACSGDPEDAPTCNDCFVYHGLLPDRSPCERIGPFSTCNQGLTCVSIVDDGGDMRDVCTPACRRPGRGDGCAYAGDGYQILFECKEGLWCDSMASGLCMDLPSPGFPCLDGAACSLDAWCDASVETPVCAALKQNGDGCTSDIECASTWCRNGLRCDRPFAEETPCVADMDRCDVGLFCPDNYPFCSKADALVCAAPIMGF